MRVDQTQFYTDHMCDSCGYTNASITIHLGEIDKKIYLCENCLEKMKLMLTSVNEFTTSISYE